MKEMLSFLEEISPCDHCPIASKCVEQRAACVDYWRWVERRDAPRSLAKKSSRYPTRQVYEYLFSGLERIETNERTKRGSRVLWEPPELRDLRNKALMSIPLKGGRHG